MLIEALKKLMPDASNEVLVANLKIINDEAQVLVDNETKGLKDNQTKNLDQITRLKGNQLPEGYDAEGYKTYTKEKSEFDKKKKDLDDKLLEDKGQWDALKLKLNETNAKSLLDLTTEKDGIISGLQHALDHELIENASMSAIEKEEGNSLFLLPHMRGQIKTLKDDNGKYSTQVVDSEGNQRFADDATTVFTVADLVAEMKANDIYSAAFPNANGGGGGDANAGGGSGGNGANPWKTETKNITEQARLNKDNPTLAAQFKKAAGVG